MADDSYEAVTNLGKAMSDLANVSDGLASSFGKLSKESAAWTIASRILSGSGLWKLQNYVRAVGNAINLYETNQLKANQAQIKSMESLMGLQKRYNELGKELKQVNKYEGEAYNLMLLKHKGNKNMAKNAAKKLMITTRQNIADKLSVALADKTKGRFSKSVDEIGGYLRGDRRRDVYGMQSSNTGRFMKEARGGYAGRVMQRYASNVKGAFGGFMSAKGSGKNDFINQLTGKSKFLFGSLGKVFGPLAKGMGAFAKIGRLLPLFLSIGVGVLIQFSVWLAGIGIGLILLVKVLRKGGFIEIFQNLNKVFKGINFDAFGLFIEAFKDIGGGIFTILKAIFKGDFGLFAEGLISLFKGILKLTISSMAIVLMGAVALLAGLIKGMINTLVDGLNALPFISGIPRLATGGSIASGGMAIVGERGPELVSLPTGARVHSNSASRNMGSNIHVHISGRVGASDSEIRDIANKVAREVNLRMNRTGSAVGRF
tara:strand:+ start:4952 stop:6412 length:1461 start_codon:yes stop_codon:yes gene_type:complete